MKKKTILLAVLACAAVTAGCGNARSGSTENASTEAKAENSQSEAQAEGGSALTFAWWGNQTRNERTQGALDLYSKNNGTIFDTQPSDWDSYWSKLQTSAAGNSLPDILQMDYSYLKQFVNSGSLVDLSPYVSDGSLDTSNISEGIIDSGSVDGKLYAMCAGMNAPGLFYNKALTDEAGVTIKDNMNLEEFKEVCRIMLEKTGTKADLPYGASDNYLPFYMRAVDVPELFNAEEKKLNVEDASVFEPFFKLYEDGQAEGWVIGADIHAGLTSNSVEESPLVYFSSRETQAWCAFFWTNQLEAMVKAAPEGVELALSTWPSPDPKKSNFLKPSQFFAVSRDAGENEKEAVKVVNYMINDVDANMIMLGERGIPASSVVAEEISPKTTETTQLVSKFVNDVVAPNSSKISPPIPTGANEVYNASNTILDEVLYGQLDAKAASERLLKEANEILSRQ